MRIFNKAFRCEGRLYGIFRIVPIFLSVLHCLLIDVSAQEKITLSYAAPGGANSIWNIAKEIGAYKKRGLDAEVVYIGSTTLSATALLSGHTQTGMVAGNGVVNTAVAGGEMVLVAGFVNVLDYELVAQPSINSAEALKGKSVGISRFGSVTDVAARAFLAELRLRPGEDVTLRQVGGAAERAAAFTQGAVAAFMSATGSIHLLGEAFPHRVLIRTSRSKKSSAVSLDLRDNHEILSDQKTGCREKSRDGADRSDAFFQDQQRANEKNHWKIFSNRQQRLP